MKIATLPRALRRPALTPVALALAGLITVAFAALIAASEITVPQQKQDGQPAVNNPNDDLMFKKFGSPLAIDIGDGNERTLYLLEGNSPQDKSDPAHLTYYHDWRRPWFPERNACQDTRPGSRRSSTERTRRSSTFVSGCPLRSCGPPPKRNS